MWEIEVTHSGLDKYRLVRGTDQYVVQQKAAVQQAIWEGMWWRKTQREKRAREYYSMVDRALLRTGEAEEKIKALETILQRTLSVDDTIEWESLKDKTLFPIPKPMIPTLEEVPDPPDETSHVYQPIFDDLDNIIPSRKREKINAARAHYESDVEHWVKKKEAVLKHNSELDIDFEKKQQAWEEEKEKFEQNQHLINEAIDRRKEQYLGKNPDAIVDYCEFVLVHSDYPDYFPRDFDLEYHADPKMLIVEYLLPALDTIPKLKEVKYIKSRNVLVDVNLPESTVSRLYDSLIYQITLRTIHELYEADVIEALESVVFNGWVESIDKSTGKRVKPCIVSLQANRAEFMEIDLANVDPKLCFKNLKGVGSSKLHCLAAIPPIQRISRDDKRFVEAYEVVGEIDESSNLAAMDWEDFEHLIRELFEEEFGQSGGEVKVTQASRDGGVDAIAYDPDPIRGGKIVIQAKRYTSTVGVAAVRDLYGTMINEGAMKGILVTTADYGPDAYDFAKDKPLTLLNGGNLLHLMEKHGHKARIDLKEAKSTLSERESSDL